MSFMGIGMLEIIMILVVAMVVLGPGRTVNMARGAGKMLGEVRRAMGDLSKALEDEDLDHGTGRREKPDLDKGDSSEERR